jgi:hypothetical protein
MAIERWEKIHLYDDFYDGPVSGIADCDGLPHLFEKIFSKEEDEYTNSYRLEPVDQPRFSMMLERNQIWLRWRIAFDSGKATLEAHPAQSWDRERYEQLNLALRGRDTPDPANSRVLSARVRKIGNFDWEICWNSPGA